MNKKEFKKSMQQGLGRCVITLQSSNSIEKYKDVVLWGCLHNLSYDTQCEGTRADYIYQLTTYFQDDDYFLMPVIEAFQKLPYRYDWLFSHFCGLLRNFAENGSDVAKDALQTKYNSLLSALLRKRRFSRYDFERDNFERICLEMFSTDGIEGLLKIAADMGCLFKENPHYTGDDFDWFCSTMDYGIGEKRLKAILERESKKSENIRCFYENYLKSIEEAQSIIQKPIRVPSSEEIENEVISSGNLSPASRVRFSKRAENEEKIKIAEKAIAETNLNVKAGLLSVFAFPGESFPLSHEIIIEYSKLSHERLSEVALDVLTNCQSDAVRKYAIELLSEQKHRSYALQMLLCNYSPSIKDLLLSELCKMKVNYKNDPDWHSICTKILNVCDQNVRLPKEFFIYIYNTTLCSCCREYAVRSLSKRRWLTRDIIEECRYDSNYDISQFINRYYPLV